MRTLAPEKIAALERLAEGSGGEANNARSVLERIGRRVPSPSTSGASGPPMVPPRRKNWISCWWK